MNNALMFVVAVFAAGAASASEPPVQVTVKAVEAAYEVASPVLITVTITIRTEGDWRIDDNLLDDWQLNWRVHGPDGRPLHSFATFCGRLLQNWVGVSKDQPIIRTFDVAQYFPDQGRDDYAHRLDEFGDYSVQYIGPLSVADSQGNIVWSGKPVSQPARFRIVRPSKESIKKALELISDEQARADDRRRAVKKLTFGPAAEAVEGIKRALASANRPLRRTAAYEAGKIGGPHIYKLLVAALEDEDEMVRAEAVGGLAEYRIPETIEKALELVSDEQAPADDRRRTVEKFTRGPAAAAVEVVKRALASTDRELRRTAAYKARKIGGPQIFNLLVAALEDGDKMVRSYAVAGLSEYRTPEAIALLVKECKLRREGNYETAIHFLGEVGDGSAIAALEEVAASDPNVGLRNMARESIEKITRRAVEKQGRP